MGRYYVFPFQPVCPFLFLLGHIAIRMADLFIRGKLTATIKGYPVILANLFEQYLLGFVEVLVFDITRDIPALLPAIVARAVVNMHRMILNLFIGQPLRHLTFLERSISSMSSQAMRCKRLFLLGTNCLTL